MTYTDLYNLITGYSYVPFVVVVFLIIKYDLNFLLIFFKYFQFVVTWPTLFSFFLPIVNEDDDDVQKPFLCLIYIICVVPCTWNDNFNFLEILMIYPDNVTRVDNYHKLVLVFVIPLFDYLYFMVLIERNYSTYLNLDWNYTHTVYSFFLIQVWVMDMFKDNHVFWLNFLII